MNDSFLQLAKYNTLDCCGTLELLPILLSQLDTERERTYHQSLALQAVACSMTLRGILVNHHQVYKGKKLLEEEMSTLNSSLNFISQKIQGKDFKPGSWQQAHSLICGSLGAKEVTLFIQGKRRVSMNREALELIQSREPLFSPLISLLLAYRDRKKLHETLSQPLDRDGRFHPGFSPTGTSTGRWSSSQNAHWTGGNIQNITSDLKSIFISDEGYKLLKVDLEQGDSRHVALDLFSRIGDDTYLQTCLSSDLHTEVAKLVWPDLPWTDDSKANRKLAEQPYYRHFDRRFMCKKLGHGTNYYGTPLTLSRQAQCDLEAVTLFQPLYLSTFKITDWHNHVIQELQLTKHLTTVRGRKRPFHGRLTDKSTWRDAFAFLGQGGTADTINIATLRLLQEVPSIQLLAQEHDSIVLQFPETSEHLIPQILSCFNNPITVSFENQTRTHNIPFDVKVGWNWGDFSDKNPDGLVKWVGQDCDTRTKRIYDPGASFMDRVIR